MLFLEVKIDNAVGEGLEKGQNKIGDSPVLFLEGKIDNAVGEAPKKGQNKNWRASCADFNGENGTAALCAKHLLIPPTRASPHPRSKHVEL